MRLFEKSFAFCLVTCGILLFALPKINLIAFSNETAGIRIDDVLLLFLSILIGWAHCALGKPTNAIERWTAAVVAFSLISFGFNRFFVAEGWLHVNANLLYCLRLAEYFIFFYVGALSTQFFKASTIIKAFFFWNVLLMFLQKTGIIGHFTVAGYSGDVSSRVLGIASFPAEAGMLLNLMFCFLIFSDKPKEKKSGWIYISPNIRNFCSKTYVYWLFLLFAILVTLTGARIALVGLAIPFIFRIKDQFRWRSASSWIFAALFFMVTATVTIVMIQKNDAVSKRSAGLLSLKNIELVEMVWDKIDTSIIPVGNEAVKFDDYDMSWWMRIHKWCYALKIYYLHPECWLQGVGPGFAMVALDGGYLRILTEYGLIGCALFWKLFSLIFRQSPQLRWIVITFAINMLFFDVYLAYKPMSIIFFISGWTWAHSKETEIKLATATI
ncbi:MAG: hypothetical protein WCF65_07485 [Parachlamydiaceae bacterium]